MYIYDPQKYAPEVIMHFKPVERVEPVGHLRSDVVGAPSIITYPCVLQPRCALGAAAAFVQARGRRRGASSDSLNLAWTNPYF